MQSVLGVIVVDAATFRVASKTKSKPSAVGSIEKERAAAYQKILKQCHLKESTRQHYIRKEAKAKAKAAKKAKELDN